MDKFLVELDGDEEYSAEDVYEALRELSPIGIVVTPYYGSE